MPYGLRVWDASGNLTLDTTDRITRYHSTVTVATDAIAPSGTLNVTVSGLTLDGTWFFVLATGSLLYVYMTISTNTITFTNTSTFQTAGNFSIDIFRG